jgi:thiosulfate reductase cytochrome b subunit
LRSVGRSLWDHVRLRLPRGEEARRYNVVQRLAYITVVLVLLPVLVAAGLAMSPAIDAALPWLPAMFGGRQSARTVHFIAATAVALFALVHIAMVLLAGVWNTMRSMITGHYAIDHED